MGHFTGYRLDLEASAELQATGLPFRDAVAGFADVPEEIDPRPWHRIEMQGGMGSCQGHALSSVCEMAYHIATGSTTQFSPLFAYYVSQKLDGLLGRDAGSTILSGVRCAKEFGQCPAEVMPYPSPPLYTGVIPSAAYAAASPFRIRSHSICRNYDDVFTFLSRGLGGVEIGIPWGSAMTPRDGRIEQFAAGGGGHAVCFLGYSRRRDSMGRRYLWLANSWSATWGVNGWAEVAPAAVDQMAAHPHTTMVGLSDLSVPVPRTINWIKESIFV